MYELYKAIINSNPTSYAHREFIGFLLIALIGLGVLLVVSLISGSLTYFERKVAAKIQSRVGPLNIGFAGYIQWVADALKLILKEDIVPKGADKLLFKLAPYLAFLGAGLTYLVLPFSKHLIMADLDVGVLFFLSVSSVAVVGILMAGWGSDNKWSLIGGIRSAAQIASYEIPSGLAILPVVLYVGSLNTQSVVKAQAGWGGFHWFIFQNPFIFVAFIVFFISMLAENNRTPFDLPEAESELVAGYNVEYSAMRFAMFFLGEFSNIFVLSAFATTLFLGGWQPLFGISMKIPGTVIDLWQIASFFIKTSVMIYLVLTIRWTLPRVRIDQMMSICWKYLVPISFVNILGVMFWLVWF